MDIIKIIIYFILLFICAYTDYKKGKIYNKNLLSFLMIYGLLYVVEYVIVFITKNTELSVLNENLKNNLIGFLIAFAIGFVFYLIGVFKGGDAKLLAVVGLCVGANQLIMHFSIIIIIAGVVALYVLIKNGIFIRRFERVFLYLKSFVLTGHFERYTSEEDDNIKFPFAVYIFIGEIVAYGYQYLRG